MKTFDWDSFFEEWKNSCKINVFAKDGIVCPEQYENILFVLKDVNDKKQTQDIDLRDNLITRTDEGRTWFPVTRWAVSLLDGKFLNKTTHKIQHQHLKRIAVMNIKKEAGGSQVDDQQVLEYAKNGHDKMIIEQIKACDPKLIIACSKVVYKALDENIFLDSTKSKEYGQLTFNDRMKNYGHYFDAREYLCFDHPVYVVEYRHPNQCGTQGTSEEHHENMLKIKEFLLNNDK